MAHGIEEASVRPPRISVLSFHLIPTSFFRKLKETPPTIPNSYVTLICWAILSMVISIADMLTYRYKERGKKNTLHDT